MGLRTRSSIQLHKTEVNLNFIKKEKKVFSEAGEKRQQEEYQRQVKEQIEEKNYWNALFGSLESKVDVIVKVLEDQK